MTSHGESTVKERPILFSAPMVRAILDGRKTQTRRIVKPQPDMTLKGEPYWNVGGLRTSWIGRTEPHWGNNPLMCKYGSVGDRLWVRETWARVNSECGPGFAYKADSEFIQPEFDGKDFGAGPSFNYEKYPGNYCMWYTDLVGGADASEGYRWTPSIHMPRWASRITLEIIGMRVERAHQITNADVLAEGISQSRIDKWRKWLHPNDVHGHAFGELWDCINGKGSWSENPWVWVVEFKKVTE